MRLTFRLAIGVAAIALVAAGAAQAQSTDRRGPDADGNGVVTRAEATAGAEAQFARMDRNGDGRLTLEDRSPAGGPDRAPPAAGPEGGPPHGQPGGPDGRGAMMMARMADTNNDRAVDRAEFLAAAEQRFDRVDADHDGSISAAERDARRSQMQQHMGRRGGDHAMPPPPPGE